MIVVVMLMILFVTEVEHVYLTAKCITVSDGEVGIGLKAHFSQVGYELMGILY